jgi:putative inorganic carbon (hco3(-)) transporter
VPEQFDTPGQSTPPVFGSGAPWVLLGGLIAGTLAFTAIVLAHEADPKIAFVAFVAALSLVTLPLIGNLRLACLYLVITFAALGLRASFFRVPHMGGAGAMFIDLVDPFMFLLLYFQMRDLIRAHVRSYRFPPAAAFWAGMIVLGIGTVIFGPLRTTAANEVVRMIKLLLLALVVLNEVVRRRQFQHVIVAITIGIILQSSVALAQYLMGEQLGLQFLGEATNEDIEALSTATLVTGNFVYRPDGLLGHANLLAGYLALYMPMAIALLLTPAPRRLKVLLTVALLVGQPALVLTLSRTGWIEYAVAFVLVLVLGALHPVARRRFLAARSLIIAGSIVGALVLSPPILQRLLESDPTAVEVRLEWLQTAWAMIEDNPVFGVGLNNYVYAQLPYGKDKTPAEMTDRYGPLWPAVHSSWALAWAEQGTIAFILWIAVHVNVIAVAVRNLRIRDPMMHALGAGLFAGFVAIMIDGLTSFFIRTEAPGRLYWIAVALILAIGYWRRANEQSASAPVEVFATPPQAEGGVVTHGKWLPSRKSILR